MEAAMSTLTGEIAAYERMRGELETDHLGKWAVVHHEVLAGLFDTFEQAASHAVERFGRGPYLIREIGAPPVTLPASVLYPPASGHAGN